MNAPIRTGQNSGESRERRLLIRSLGSPRKPTGIAPSLPLRLRALHSGRRCTFSIALATAVAAVGAHPGRAVAADDVNTGDFELKASLSSPDGNLQAMVNQLDAELHKSGVQNLLDNANRNATFGSACTTDPFGSMTPPANRYCFDAADSNTREWIPQGVTSVSDAQDDELWGDHQALVVASYDNWNPGTVDGVRCFEEESRTNDACNEKGVRVTFLNPATNKYRHVLLVWPYINNFNHVSFDAVHARDNPPPAQSGIHAGGIVWYGNYLYVADTTRGLRVFDMRYIFDLDPDGNPDTNDPTQDGLTTDVDDPFQIGRQSNVFYSYGYRYVMPQIAAWVNNAGPDHPGDVTYCNTDGAPKFSYVALDRASVPDQLITGEYCNPTDAHASNGRVALWPLNGATGELLYQRVGDDDIVHATDAFRLPVSNVQGAGRASGNWYFSTSNGCANGHLVVATHGTGGWSIDATRQAAVGPEDLSFWRGKNLMWTVTEHRIGTEDGDCTSSPAGRVLYGVSP